jgi:hypothetical protein
MITAAQVATGKVPHWDRFLPLDALDTDYKIVIPSFDRPAELCGNTLTLLKREGIDMDRVNIFVSPVTAKNKKQPEWYRYADACIANGFSEVHIRPGGRNLEEQMAKAMEWAGSGYIIVMSDTVRRILSAEKKDDKVAPLETAKGSLPCIFEHGYQLMQATGCVAWSVNPSHNPKHLEHFAISRKLGLLDGNLTGMMLPNDWKRMKVTKGHGLIYDVEWSAALWNNGYRFFRYRGLCCEHRYRQEGGQATLMKDALYRRKVENEAIRKVSEKYPECLAPMHKPRASLRTMEYKFFAKGPSNLFMTIPQPGRKRKYHMTTGSTSTERMRRMRQRRKVEKQGTNTLKAS